MRKTKSAEPFTNLGDIARFKSRPKDTRFNFGQNPPDEISGGILFAGIIRTLIRSMKTECTKCFRFTTKRCRVAAEFAKAKSASFGGIKCHASASRGDLHHDNIRLHSKALNRVENVG